MLRLLTEEGHRVRVVPTKDALRFVGEATWAGLSGEPVTTDVWTGVQDAPHVRLGKEADLVLVVPATADLLARAAHGRADDLLTATLLMATCPIVYAPAMHTEMWQHPATTANVRTLRERGALVIEPASGRLAGHDSGPGRLPDPDEIAAIASRILSGGKAHKNDLAGRKITISAGGTREEIDPVRFIGNWSSGRQGYAFARAAVARGAEVTLIAANVSLPDPAGAKVIKVTSALDLRAAMNIDADAIVMAAAVADYRPAERNPAKLKKDGQTPAPLRLRENPDILAGLARARGEGRRPILVGFAAETDPTPDQARDKLDRKGCDLLVVNPVGGGRAFGTDDNEAVIYARDGSETPVPRGPKDVLADIVLDLIAADL